MDSTLPSFRQPTAIERAFNKTFGFLVGMGLGFSYNYLLQVRGRKSGKIYSTPIDLLEIVLSISQKYGIDLRAEDCEAFVSLSALTAHVNRHRTK